jgi:AhpD family alkylhydroperoxidase
MTAFIPVDPALAEGKAARLLAAVQAKLGITPNMTRQMACAPAVLDGYLAFAGALADGPLDVRLREQIALVTAEANACEYCLSAHAALGKSAGLSSLEIAAARTGGATDAKARAALRFAQLLARIAAARAMPTSRRCEPPASTTAKSAK